MSELLDFYRENGKDREGRTLAAILHWSDDDLEAVHDFIQWLFPLPEPSRFNSAAPLLTDVEISEFKNDARLRANLQRSFDRILEFFGLELKDGSILERANFDIRVHDIWSAPNHNWLRISRILRCLTLLGLEDEARAFFRWLESEYTKRRFPISADTFRYWTEAVRT